MVTEDKRRELIEKILMWLMTQDTEINVEDAKNALYMLSTDYEIMSRSTELTVLRKDRNEELLKRFIIAKTVIGLSQRTLEVYQTEVGKILMKIGKTVDDITADDIRLYLAIRQRRDHVTKTTANNELRYLKSFYSFLMAEEIITRNPTLKIEKIKTDKTKKEALTDEEVEYLRVNTRDERESALIEVLLSTGCRVTEIINIKISDIEGNRILVYGKGAKERYVYLNARALVAVERYLKKRKDTNPYLFAGGSIEIKNGKRDKNYRWWQNPEYVSPDEALEAGSVETITRRMAKRAGVQKANPHKFRRTCATMALRRGMPIEQVSKMLGHEQISTTQIYLDLTEEELEQMHRKYVV